MKLSVQGLHYRTSGSAAPFDLFNREFEGIEGFLGQTLEVGCRNYALRIDEIEENGLALTFVFEDGEESLSLSLGQKETLRHVRNVLGVEVTFELSKE